MEEWTPHHPEVTMWKRSPLWVRMQENPQIFLSRTRPLANPKNSVGAKYTRIQLQSLFVDGHDVGVDPSPFRGENMERKSISGENAGESADLIVPHTSTSKSQKLCRSSGYRSRFAVLVWS